MKKNWLISVRYVYPVIVFFIISVAYFVPDALQGRKLFQSDIVHYKGKCDVKYGDYEVISTI